MNSQLREFVRHFGNRTFGSTRRRRGQRLPKGNDLALASGTGLRFIIDLEKGKPTCHLGKGLGILLALGLRIKLVKT